MDNLHHPLSSLKHTKRLSEDDFIQHNKLDNHNDHNDHNNHDFNFTPLEGRCWST